MSNFVINPSSFSSGVTWEQPNSNRTYTMRANDGFALMQSLESGNILIGKSGSISVTFKLIEHTTSGATSNVICGVWDTPGDSDEHNSSSNFQLIESKTQASMPEILDDVTWSGTISSPMVEGNAIGIMYSNSGTDQINVNTYNSNADNSLWYKNTGTAESEPDYSNQITVVVG